MNRTIIYARVSTEDQLEKYGLPTQIRACHEYAARNGMTVTGEVTDDGISGTVLNRPGLERVRKMVRAGEIDAVLMLDVDRLSRVLSHLLILKPEIEKLARLEFVTCKFEDSPSGRMFFGIRGVIGEYERELTRERTMRGQKERARAGLLVGGRVPYGYIYRDGNLIEDPERAPIARRIFAGYEAGESIRGIAARLRQSGAPTCRGGKWGKSSVQAILKNETYAGLAHFGASRREGDRLVKIAPSERIEIAVPALIARDQWERVSGRLIENASVGRPSTTAFLLRGLMYCAKCGHKMTGNNSRSKKWSYYRCTGTDPLVTEVPCRNTTAEVGRLEAAVWRSLSRAFGDAEFLREKLRQREEELRSIQPGQIEALRIRIRKLRGKEESAMGLMLDPDFAAERPKIKAEYRAAIEERRRVEADLAALDRVPLNTGDWLDQTVLEIRQFMLHISPEKKQQFVRHLVQRAEWTGEEIRMVVFLGPKLATTPQHNGQFDGLQVVLTERVAA